MKNVGIKAEQDHPDIHAETWEELDAIRAADHRDYVAALSDYYRELDEEAACGWHDGDRARPLDPEPPSPACVGRCPICRLEFIDAFWAGCCDTCRIDLGVIRSALGECEVDHEAYLLALYGVRPGPEERQGHEGAKQEWLPMWIEQPRVFRSAGGTFAQYKAALIERYVRARAFLSERKDAR